MDKTSNWVDSVEVLCNKTISNMSWWKEISRYRIREEQIR